VFVGTTKQDKLSANLDALAPLEFGMIVIVLEEGTYFAIPDYKPYQLFLSI